MLLEKRTVHAAFAIRDVGVFSEMDTMRADPESDTWVRRASGGLSLTFCGSRDCEYKRVCVAKGSIRCRESEALPMSLRALGDMSPTSDAGVGSTKFHSACPSVTSSSTTQSTAQRLGFAETPSDAVTVQP